MSERIALWFAYGFCTSFAAVSFFFVLSRAPETKGMELEAMKEATPARRRASVR